jgi:hypothetical protein
VSLLVISGAGVLLIALLAAAMRAGATRISEAPGGCLTPHEPVPDAELTRETAARLYRVHRGCACRVRELSRDVLDATGGLPDDCRDGVRKSR